MKCYDLDNTHTYGSEYKNDCNAKTEGSGTTMETLSTLLTCSTDLKWNRIKFILPFIRIIKSSTP